MTSALVWKWARRCLSTEAMTTATATDTAAKQVAGVAGRTRPRLGSKDLYLCDLSPSSQAQEIHHLFSRQGRIRSITMHFNQRGAFARTAVVKFNTYEEAELALEEHRRHGTMLNGVQIQVTSTGSLARQADLNASANVRPVKQGPGAQIFVSNMSYTTTADQIRAAFSSFGSVLDVNLFKRDNQSMGMVKVLFARKADADAAIKALNEVSFDGRTLFVKMDSNYISTGDAVATSSKTGDEAVHHNDESADKFDDNDDLMRSINAAADAPVDGLSLEAAMDADNAALERELERQPSA